MEDCDLITTSMPLPLVREVHRQVTEKAKLLDKDLLDGLAEIGFKLDFGEDDTGWQFKYLTRGGGYYFNVGCSDLLIDGAIGFAQFDDIETFTREGALLKEWRSPPRRPHRPGHRLSGPGGAGRKTLRCRYCPARRPDLGLWRRARAAQHVCPDSPARPLVHRRQLCSVPHLFEIPWAADQGVRGGPAAAESRARHRLTLGGRHGPDVTP